MRMCSIRIIAREYECHSHEHGGGLAPWAMQAESTRPLFRQIVLGNEKIIGHVVLFTDFGTLPFPT